MIDSDSNLTAVYYPYSRCLDAQSLKRAVLLYDRLIFIDPKSAQVRAGLFSVENHQQYLPDDAARWLEHSWQAIESDYAVLVNAGAVEFVDPTRLVASASVDAVITGNMQADMKDPAVLELFSNEPRVWSMLRSRIPLSAWPFLHHQYTPRVLYEQNKRGPFAQDRVFSHALIADGRPDQRFSMPASWGEPTSTITPRRRAMAAAMEPEYAVVVPYYLGSSLATSMAMAICASRAAIPFTDSSPHFQLLSRRFSRAAETQASAQLPRLESGQSLSDAHLQALIERRVVDSVLSPEDLAKLSLEDVLEYRLASTKQRAEFRNWLRRVVSAVTSEPWSPTLNREIEALILKTQDEMKAQAAELRNIYGRIFKRAAIGVGMTAAPLLLNVIFPGVPLLVAFIFGAGNFTGVLADPIKDLLDTLGTNRSTNGLAYFLRLRDST